MFSDPVMNADNYTDLAKSSVELLLVLRQVAEKDLQVIIDLFKKEVAPGGDLKDSLHGFAEMFASFRGSDTSHAFIVWLGKVPLFEIEFHLAEKQTTLQNGFSLESKDYNLSMMSGDLGLAELPVYVQGLGLCLDYFWGISEVERIIAPVYAGLYEDQQADLLKEAGFMLTLKKADPREPDLYTIVRPR